MAHSGTHKLKNRKDLCPLTHVKKRLTNSSVLLYTQEPTGSSPVSSISQAFVKKQKFHAMVFIAVSLLGICKLLVFIRFSPKQLLLATLIGFTHIQIIQFRIVSIPGQLHLPVHC
jgi:hypothetical protein